MIQDTDVISCVIGSLYTAQAIPLKNAIQTLISCNLGSCLILYFFFFDIKPLVFITLCLCAFSFYLEKPVRWRYAISALMNLCLMLFAVLFLEKNASAILEVPSLTQWFYQLASQPPIYIFLLSILVMVTTYSDLPLYVVTASLAKAHLISPEIVMLVIYGVHCGCAINLFIFSSGAQGKMRQIFFAQMLFDLTIALPFLAIFAVEYVAGTHILTNLFFNNPLSPEYQIVNFLIFVTSVGLIVAYFFSSTLSKWMLKTAYFDDPNNSDRCLRYINNNFARDTGSGTDLIYKEIIQLTKRIPTYLELRLQSIDTPPILIEEKHKIFIELCQQVKDFSNQLVSSQFSPQSLPRYFLTQDDFHLVICLEETIYQISTLQTKQKLSTNANLLFSQILESEHAIISVLLEAMETNVTANWNVIQALSYQGGELYEKIRNNFFKNHKSCTAEEQNLIFQLTHLMERTTWIIRRLEPL